MLSLIKFLKSLKTKNHSVVRVYHGQETNRQGGSGSGTGAGLWMTVIRSQGWQRCSF